MPYIVRYRKNDCPCYGCTFRQPGCHAKCPSYVAWKAECSETHKDVANEMYKDGIVEEYRNKTAQRLSKRWRVK